MMTARQKQVLDFLDREITRHGKAPSYREMASYFGWTNASGVHRLVCALEERGFLRREGRSNKVQISIVRRPTSTEIIATGSSAPSRTDYTSFRFDDHLKTLVEHRKFTAVA